MIEIRKATQDDLEQVISSRFEMIKVVNDLSEEASFDQQFINMTIEYFKKADQTTILAIDGQTIGCATICYINVMPTFDHPTGKRAHIMNVYTKKEFRRQGIAYRMMKLLIEEAKNRGVTEISLDATKEGCPLYERCGFVNTADGMVLTLR